MWISFFVYAAALLAVLFVPGYAALRCAGLSKTISLGFAPMVCTVLFCCLGCLFHAVGITSTPLLFIVVLLVLCGGAVSVRVLPALFRGGLPLRRGAALFSFGAKVLALYVVLGAVCATWMFLLPLDGPGSAVQTYDNVHQFGLIRSFVDSGAWCPIHTSLYLDPASSIIDPVPGSGYYPAAFHVLAAFVVSLFGCGVNVAANAVLFSFVAFVLPVEVFALLRVLFNGDLRRTAFGAPFFAVLPSFPWLLVDYWPLYPNVISMVLLPTIIVSFIGLLADKSSLRARCRYAALFLVSLVCAVFTQPNGVFSAGAFLIPFVVYRAAQVASTRCKGSKRVAAWLVGGFCFLLCAIVWVVLAKTPFLQGVVNFYWDPVFDWGQAVLSAIGVTFLSGDVIPFGAFALVAGFASGVSSSRTRWFCLSFLLVCFMYVVAASAGDTWLKHLVSGFWYTDPYRVGAFASLCAVPVLALGADAICKVAANLVSRFVRDKRVFALPLQAGVFSLCLLGMIGSFFGNGALAVLESNAAMLNDQASYAPYDAAKRDFAQRVAALVPEGETLLNDPYDGSLFAYGIDGLNLYYRHMSGYDGVDSGWESSDSEIIRLHACDSGFNEDVRQDLVDLGIRYVLKFGETSAWSAATFPDYVAGDWDGIESIQDDTPGFSVILAEGNMRLYEIER